MKEAVNHRLKHRVVEANVRNLDRAANNASVAHGDRRNLDWEETYERRLAGAIFERIHRATSQRGIPLVIQSIPSESQQPYRLIEMFPFEEFDVYRKGTSQ